MRWNRVEKPSALPQVKLYTSQYIPLFVPRNFMFYSEVRDPSETIVLYYCYVYVDCCKRYPGRKEQAVQRSVVVTR